MFYVVMSVTCIFNILLLIIGKKKKQICMSLLIRSKYESLYSGAANNFNIKNLINI